MATDDYILLPTHHRSSWEATSIDNAPPASTSISDGAPTHHRRRTLRDGTPTPRALEEARPTAYPEPELPDLEGFKLMDAIFKDHPAPG
jgi:hypothetical protein